MDTVTRLEPGRLVAGRYRIEAPVGEGGMGVVYRVRHVHTEEALALKVLHAHVLRDASAVERFRREARTPARIASDHVARVTDADTAADLGGAPFYVMELLDGTDLERLVAARGALAPAVVVELLQQAARALDKAHALGIVHRDLKPENLFLTQREDGAPFLKLLDFGIARIADDRASSHKTQAGYVFGTPAYMAPEQAVGDVDRIAPATDIWALGLVAFKLLTGVDFWGEPSLGQLIARTMSEPMPVPSACGSSFGAGFDRWFEICCARLPEARFTTASTAVAALADALALPRPTRTPSRQSLPPPSPLPGFSAATRTLSAAPLSISQPPASPPPRSSLALVLGLLALAGILALGGTVALVALVSRGDAERAPTASGAGLVANAAPVEPTPLPADAGAVARVEDAAPPALTALVAPPSAARGGTSRKLGAGQKERLVALQRLCQQGTFTPDECSVKQTSILRE